MTPEMPAATLETMISTFASQAAVSLGQIENPVTKKKETDLDQAKFAIDLLGVLQEKTKGNLEEKEAEFLEQCLYQLRMVYIDAKAKKEK